MTREGTCQSLQSRALSLDVDSKQWLYFTLLYFTIEENANIYACLPKLTLHVQGEYVQ